MSRTRRQFTTQQKAAIVRRHLAAKEPVSTLADELQIQPSLIHLSVKQVLEQAERGFERPGAQRRDQSVKDHTIERLQAKLQQKNEVIAESRSLKGARKYDRERTSANKSQWGALKGRSVPHDIRG